LLIPSEWISHVENQEEYDRDTYIIFFFGSAGVELRALCMLAKHSALRVMPPACVRLFLEANSIQKISHPFAQ
jgi:hypothetical protein